MSQTGARHKPYAFNPLEGWEGTLTQTATTNLRLHCLCHRVYDQALGLRKLHFWKLTSSRQQYSRQLRECVVARVDHRLEECEIASCKASKPPQATTSAERNPAGQSQASPLLEERIAMQLQRQSYRVQGWQVINMSKFQGVATWVFATFTCPTPITIIYKNVAFAAKRLAM